MSDHVHEGVRVEPVPVREPVEVCNRWRVEEAWWGEPIARDYVKVVGRRWLALVYLDRVAGTWHLERVYD